MQMSRREITRIVYNAVREWDGDMSVPIFDELTPRALQDWTDRVERVIDHAALEGENGSETDRVIEAVVEGLR